MRNRPLTPLECERLGGLLKSDSLWDAVVARIQMAGGRIFLVGGLVRDLILGRQLKDIDVEVHHLSLAQLKEILESFAPAQEVGKSFGVLKWRGIDWALPRSDGPGRKPAVAVDPEMSIEKALERRDLTMNAMAIDVAHDELIDLFGGEADLAAGRLRVTNSTRFVEDPLRFFRVMQFIGRFDLEPDNELDDLCKKMDISSLSQERIYIEYEKLLLLSRAPSRGFRWLKKIERLDEILPELGATVSIEQPLRWHPEGVVFEHIMQVVDAAAQQRGLPVEQRKLLLYGALAHDLGKVEATKRLPDGRLTAQGHEEVGVSIARTLLRRMTGDKDFIKSVLIIVRHHMAPGIFVKNNARPAAYKRLALKIYPLSIWLLATFGRADLAGRNPVSNDPLPGPFPVVDEFEEKADAIGVLFGPEEPVLRGSDFIDFVSEGPLLGDMIRRAYEIQIAENCTEAAILKKRVVQEYIGKLFPDQKG
ncbi:MAG: CCA tRNA nucleotidyltransferase [Candidatus Babeliaceae bacterium]|nr:CCA tRNA nucleotidyltransferase [Candidatus Babeliaceae bacterium]